MLILIMLRNEASHILHRMIEFEILLCAQNDNLKTIE